MLIQAAEGLFDQSNGISLNSIDDPQAVAARVARPRRRCPAARERLAFATRWVQVQSWAGPGRARRYRGQAAERSDALVAE
jgi:hypothetical protein